MNFLEVENVSKSFAEHRALTDVSIEVPDNSIFGLLGPNGAGKTTLIRIINQISMPDSGIVRLNGEKLNREHIGQIGYLPEERGLYKKMKVGEQAVYLARLKGLTKADATKKLVEWFRKFEIEAWWDKKVEELSKGMQQKVQFITTILHEPKLLIFDEPFSGFDPINANLLKQEILELKEKGATIIFSTHNMESVEAICDTIALINRSKVILEGSIDSVKEKYKSNLFEVQFKGEVNRTSIALTADYKILEIAQNKHGYLAKVELQAPYNTNQMLKTLLSAGDIIGFNEIIPSMNEVFIKVVEKNIEQVDALTQKAEVK